MATEYTSSYWSSVGSTDRARRRADQLLDTLAKRALIFQNTCDFQWDIDDDAELEEFLESMVRAACASAVSSLLPCPCVQAEHSRHCTRDRFQQQSVRMYLFHDTASVALSVATRRAA